MTNTTKIHFTPVDDLSNKGITLDFPLNGKVLDDAIAHAKKSLAGTHLIYLIEGNKRPQLLALVNAKKEVLFLP